MSNEGERDYGCYCYDCPYIDPLGKCNHSDAQNGGLIVELNFGVWTSDSCPAE